MKSKDRNSNLKQTNMKTLLGKEIPTDTKGILYLCHYSPSVPSIVVLRELFFTSGAEALNTYANTRNPESQLVTASTYDKIVANLEILHKRMANKEWLEDFKNYL